MQKRSRKKKRPDVNELAADIVDQATNEEPEDDKTEEPEVDDGKNPAAVALGRLGGLKGGKARAKKLTKKQRSEAARKAALARWKKHDDNSDGQ
ncbi:MAG: hypothetical protein KAW46_12310 [candidate division Zixibacteria bacterium]|nr:hypothetical protein [candidate division Zixibacteria bacterium]